MDSDARSQNGFLASLDAADFEALSPHLRTVALTQSERLVQLGDTIKHVYLPHSGVISLVVELDEGERVEVAMIGRDSVLNLSGVLGASIAVTNAVVMLSGVASILDVDRLRMETERRPALRGLLVRHGMTLFAIIFTIKMRLAAQGNLFRAWRNLFVPAVVLNKRLGKLIFLNGDIWFSV